MKATLLPLAAIAVAISIAGCSDDTNGSVVARINNYFQATEFVIAPAVAEVATLTKLALKIRSGADRSLIGIGQVAYQKGSCTTLRVKGKFLSAEGRTLSAALATIGQYGKGDEQNSGFCRRKLFQRPRPAQR